MIKAEELRIGNLITTPDGIKVVDGIATYYKKPIISCVGNSWVEQSVSPITLTPEMLEKCGFYKTPATKGCFNWYHKSGCFGLDYNKLQGLIYCSPFLDLPITSLHQLQNIFYTNTQTELTINL